MPTLCLTMIVNNESKVILRALDSVCQYLDYWCIQDTGSTDGTQKLIKGFFDKKGIPGELHETPWENFGYNRTKAVESARNKADYLLLMDADFVFCVKDRDFKSKMTADGYNIQYEGNMDYRQNLLIKSALNWRYIGVTHEYIHSTQARLPIPSFDGFTFNHLFDDDSRHDKFERDIRLLEQGIKDEPNNGRYYFYLGQSYFDLGKYDKAIPHYQKRVDNGGWPEEVYYSLYRIGLSHLNSNKPFSVFSSALLRAYFFRPQRLEALYNLVRYCRLHQDRVIKERGFYLGMMGVNSVYPKDLLFIDKPVHAYQLLDEVAMCAHFTDHHLEACQLGERILRERHYPANEDTRLRSNHGWYLKGYQKHFGHQYGESGETRQHEVVLRKDAQAKNPQGAQQNKRDTNSTRHNDEQTKHSADADDTSPRIAILANYSSIGGSEMSIKELHKKLVLHYGKDQVVLIENYQRAKDFKPNILVSQQTYVEASNKLARELEIPLIILVHGAGQFTLANQQCRLIIYNSHQLLSQEQDGLPATAEAMVLQPSIDLADGQESVPPARDRKYITLISSATYPHLKGNDLFIALARQFPEQKFLLVGKPGRMKPETLQGVGMLYPPEANHWALGQGSATEQELPSNLTVMDNTREIEKVYQKTRILMVPSYAESFGRVALEAAGYGIPTVCSDLPGLREATVNLAKYVMKHRSVFDFAVALSAVLDNYDSYQKKTEVIVQTYQQKQAESMKQLYEIIDKRFNRTSNSNSNGSK